MGRLTWTRTTTAGAFGALTLVLALASCSPEPEPAPSPTTPTTEATEAPSPTPTATAEPTTPTAEPTPELTVEQQHVAEAEQTVRDYYAATSRVGADGYATWAENLAHFWGSPAVSDPYIAYYQTAASTGLSSTGDTVVDSIQVLTYTADPTGAGHELLLIEFCEDNSGVTNLNADGSVSPKELPERFVWEALIQRQAPSVWTFTELTAHDDRSC